ncbi:MAG: hypothetical protein HYS21_11610 [Deltaproteobacteria bacterium]|nr:hypothetical protein [Deltaproteobacteria bacterium]
MLKPSPALPDTAIAFEGRAQFAFRSAKSEGDFLKAAQEYEKAVAPWVPGYYADLCTIYEKADKFEDARRHCGFYLIGLNDPAQVTDVKRRIAGLEFGIEKVTKQAVNRAQEQRISGAWKYPHAAGDGVPRLQILPVRQNSDGKWNFLQDYYIDNKQVIKEAPIRCA